MNPASLLSVSGALILLALAALVFAGAGNQQIPHSNIVRVLYWGGGAAALTGVLGLIWAGSWVVMVLFRQ